MKTITADLLEKLKNTDNIKNFLEENTSSFINITTVEFLSDMLVEKNITIGAVSKASGIGEYVYKIFSGERKTTRDSLIAIAFAMDMSLAEIQLLLRISKFAILDSRDKRDSVIIHSIINNLSVFEADDVLASNELLTIN